MGSVLKEQDSTKVEGLKTELAESAASLQSAHDSNSVLLGKNKDLAAELARLKLENDRLLARCLSAKEKEKEVLVEQEKLVVSSSAKRERADQFQPAPHKVGEDLQRTQDFVLHPHESRFNKGLEQAAFFYGIPLDEGKILRK
ncbi:hypothetical protein PHAVU_001G068700 [Phaseolus vulgaris]|uniref:Uncharacterized protein n=1 Tax=Phaseolus vulgaris TaxID=3885 RepID=V7CTB6_PHAVU|nr:hypothetical protein PHAVU_001G068700g [Phaseolus vulgaris]ESW33432.1 hypothetical protein PHAVU_001G068700g [Phaseolus vulgaris]